MKFIVVLMICLTLISGCASVKPEFDSQIEAGMAYFEKHTFTALVNFHVHGNYDIDENGKPLDGKDQSARLGSKGMFTKDFAVAKGAKGYIFYYGLKEDNILAIGVSATTGVAAAWNPSNIYVHFSRPITRQDLTPEAVARVLSSMLVFDDFKPGSELDGLLDEIDSKK